MLWSGYISAALVKAFQITLVLSPHLFLSIALDADIAGCAPRERAAFCIKVVDDVTHRACPERVT